MDQKNEPSLSLNREEISLISEGLAKLPSDRSKTVVFERLMTKVNKVKDYWTAVDRIKEQRKQELARETLTKKTENKSEQ